MPCDGSKWSDEEWERMKAEKLLEGDINEYKKEINELKQLIPLLCYACKLLDSYGALEGDYNLEPFYSEHEFEDKMKLNKCLREYDVIESKDKHLETVKKRLMIQLTPIEKLALNLELTEHERKLIGVKE